MKKPEIKQNIADKVVSYFSPESGIKRMRARKIMALSDAYTGASTSRRSMYDFTPVSQSADDAIKYSRDMLVRRGHHMYRNNPIVTGSLDSNCMSIIGPGLQMHSRIDGKFLKLSDDQREEKETQLEREWRLFSESTDCDISRTNNFGQLQNMTLLQSFVTGESFTILPYLDRPGFPYSLKIQIVEPERVYNDQNRADGPVNDRVDLYDGIEKDRQGAPIRYHIADFFPYQMTGKTQSWHKIDAFGGPYGLRNVLHHYMKKRPGQTRGVSLLAPVLEKLHTLDKYMKAYLDIALVQALFTVFITHENQASGGDLPMYQPDSETDATSSDDDYKMGPGAIIDLPVGDKIQTATPGMPNANLDPFIMAIYREIGIGLNIPVEILTKHFNSSFTAAKAAFNEAWRFYRMRRSWLVSTFCQPIYERFLFECIARGRVDAPGFFDDPLVRAAYCGAEWVGPAQGHLNPVQEADAIEKRIKNNITTIEQETAEYNGGQFDRNIAQRKREVALVKDAGAMEEPKPAFGQQPEKQPDEEPDKEKPEEEEGDAS